MSKEINGLPLINYRLSLHCPSPTRKRKDKEESLTAESNAASGVFRVQMEKIPASFQKPITAIQAKIRNFFDSHCFRLNDTYAIPVSQFERFEAGYQPLIAMHDAYVQSLVDAIEDGSLEAEARIRMGDEFQTQYVPLDPNAVPQKIRVDVRVVADLDSNVISRALNDLGDEVAEATRERIKCDSEALEAEQQSSIVGYVMNEVVECLKYMAKSCEGDRTQYKAMRDKFVRVTETLPAYNVTGNAQIAGAIDRVYEAFKTLDKDGLKQDKAYRAQTAATATEILNEIGTFKF